MTSLMNIDINNANGINYINNTEEAVLAYNISTQGCKFPSNETMDCTGITKNVVVPSIMFFLGVLGNVSALIILTVRPSKDSKSSAFYHLVKALVCMDLFGIVASSPVTIVVYINDGVIKTGGMPLCHYFSFILVMAGNATVFTVLVMAAERYLVTKFPFQYNRVVRPLTVNCCILVVWGLSTLTALLPIIGLGKNIEPWPGTWCFFDYRNPDVGGHIYSYTYAIAGLAAIVITIALNLTVMKYLWRMRRSRLSTTSLRSSEHFTGTRDKGGPDSEKRMIVFLMAITVVFTVCYAPFMVRIIMNQMMNAGFDLKSGGPDDVFDLWALRLACLNQILDPWVYIISRVTCCKSSRDRDRDFLSQSTKSYHAVTHGSDRAKAHTPISPEKRTKDSNIIRTLQSIRHIFRGKSLESGDKEAVTLPLQPTLMHTLTSPTLENGTKGRTVNGELYA